MKQIFLVCCVGNCTTLCFFFLCIVSVTKRYLLEKGTDTQKPQDQNRFVADTVV